MPVYTVHAPLSEAAGERTDRFVFLRDGFHFWAMVFGPFWLLWHRLWLALLGYLAVCAALGTVLALSGAGAGVRALVFLLLAILMGLEAGSLRRFAYARGKWRQIDFVVADDAESAERHFFDRFTENGEAGQPPTFHVPTAPHQPRATPSMQQGIIGLFPEPGGSR